MPFPNDALFIYLNITFQKTCNFLICSPKVFCLKLINFYRSHYLMYLDSLWYLTYLKFLFYSCCCEQAFSVTPVHLGNTVVSSIKHVYKYCTRSSSLTVNHLLRFPKSSCCHLDVSLQPRSLHTPVLHASFTQRQQRSFRWTFILSCGSFHLPHAL